MCGGKEEQDTYGCTSEAARGGWGCDKHEFFVCLFGLGVKKKKRAVDLHAKDGTNYGDEGVLNLLCGG